MRKEDWKYISNRIARRKRESGEDSEVYIDGVQCPPAKVRKETARHGFVTTIEKFRLGNIQYQCKRKSNPLIPDSSLTQNTGRSSRLLTWTVCCAAGVGAHPSLVPVPEIYTVAEQSR
jgi:hypothetical protein